MPACISRGEKSKFDQRCQESRLNEFTDCEGTEQSCSCSCLQLPRDSPTPFSAHPSLEEKGRLRGLGTEGAPDVGLTFHTHAVVKAFVVQASVVGRAEVFPEVAAGPCPQGKSTLGQPRRADPPCALHTLPLDRRYIISMVGPSRAGWTIWCARLPAGTTDECHGQGPWGQAAETPDAPDGQLIDRSRRWPCRSTRTLIRGHLIC